MKIQEAEQIIKAIIEWQMFKMGVIEEDQITHLDRLSNEMKELAKISKWIIESII